MWIASGKKLHFLFLSFCSVTELRVVTSRMLRPGWSYWRQDLNMIFCMCGVCRHSWMAALPSSQGTASTWHLWVAKKGMAVLSTSCLEHLCSQKLLFVDLGVGCLIIPIHCIAMCFVQGCSWENLTCCPTLLASKALCWRLRPTHFLLGFVLHRKLHVITNKTVLKRSSICWKF